MSRLPRTPGCSENPVQHFANSPISSYSGTHRKWSVHTEPLTGLDNQAHRVVRLDWIAQAIEFIPSVLRELNQPHREELYGGEHGVRRCDGEGSEGGGRCGEQGG